MVSNGPLLELTVNGQGPGATIQTAAGRVKVGAQVISRIPFERVEIIQDGRIVADQASVGGREVRLEREIPVEEGGWIAARVTGGAKTYAGFTAFAHTSPVYLRVPETPFRRAEAIGAFIDEIGRSMRAIHKGFKFESDAQRALALGKFEEGQKAFAKLL